MKIIYTTILVLCLFAASFAQKKESTDLSAPKTDELEVFSKEEQDIIGKLLIVNLTSSLCGIVKTKPECKTVLKDRYDLYLKISKYPKLLRFLAAEAIDKYNENKDQAKSAPQASQIADQQNAELLQIIVLQNQRIIELLEKLATKPK
jgi:hypothetical protein